MTQEIILYLEKLRYEKDVSRHTLRAYHKDLADFSAFCTDKNITSLDQLNPEHISQWLENLSQSGLQARSVARKLAAASSFARFLLKEGRISHQSFALFRAPKARKNMPLTVSSEEMCRFLSDLPNRTLLEKRNKILFFTLYGTGLRSEELCQLRLSDLFLERGVLRVLGKGQKERLVPLLPEVQEQLKIWLGLRPALDKELSPALFLSYRGLALETSFIRKLCKDLPLPGKQLHPHAFRYSFASHLLNNGADLRSIQELLGHSKLSTTERYTKLGIDRMRSQFQRCHPHA